MKSICMPAFVVLIGAAWASAAQTAADPFLGRWNIEIRETGDTFRTAWLDVVRKDGGLGGELVWKWGSVVPIKNVAVAEDELRFTRGKESFTVRRAGDELRGVATMEGGKKLEFVGWRAPEMCEVAGTWKVGLKDDPDAPRATLVLEESGGKISGKATDPDGHSYTIRNARLDGFVFSFEAVIDASDEPVRSATCEVRGDELVGRVAYTPPGESEKVVEFVGKREREWGEPVRLLKKDSLEGWAPRDPKRKFGWKVADGVLENNPPDVDIRSEAKFRDFRLELEYKVNPRSNSGIYLRGRYELQVLGDTRVQDHGNMAVYSRLKPATNPVKPGEWNKLEVTFIGRWLTVVLNGETVHDNRYLEGPTGGAWDAREGEPGPLLLQGDHGKVWYRNIVVTPAR